MINEGSSLAELQARVLLASRRETKSENSLTVYLDRYSFEVDLSVHEQIREMMTKYWTQQIDDWMFGQLTNTPLRRNSAPKASVRATSAATSRRVGRRADYLIVDDIA